MYPSVDAIVIEAPSGARLEQPLLDHWVERVDMKARQIHLASVEGLIDVPGGAAAPDSPAADGDEG
jgi:hypothetical protein